MNRVFGLWLWVFESIDLFGIERQGNKIKGQRPKTKDQNCVAL